jgi:N-acetylmuramoyl-L-alanine amidase
MGNYMSISKAAKQCSEELKFHNTLTGTGRTKFKAFETPGSDIIKLDPGHNTHYYKSVTAKDKIIIHSTAGYLRHDVVQLTQKDNKVSVNYVISRDGVIYELFDPKYWSYHLGRGASGGNKVNSSSSISIELCNIGPLTMYNGKLCTIYSTETRKDYYCTEAETNYYTKSSYRGYDYYASFPDKQYVALKYLLDHLCDTHDIPYEFVDINSRHDTFTSTEAKAFKGICTHVNYRKTGKYDLGPFFDWKKIERNYRVLSNNSVVETNDIVEPVEVEKVRLPEVNHVSSTNTGRSPFVKFILGFVDVIMKIIGK